MKIQAFLQESPLIAIIWAARRFEAQLHRLLKPKTLNLSSALVLVTILFEEPCHVTPSQLARILSMTRGNVSHAVSSLEASGLLARRINPDDARAFQLILKPQGKKVAMNVVRVLHQMQTSFEKTIGASHIQSMIHLISRMETACERLDAPGQ